MVTGCGMEERCSIFGKGRDFSLRHHIQTLWSPPKQHLASAYQGLSPRSLRLVIHVNLVPQLNIHGFIPPLRCTTP
jgi:hypothetical protein